MHVRTRCIVAVAEQEMLNHASHLLVGLFMFAAEYEITRTTAIFTPTTFSQIL